MIRKQRTLFYFVADKPYASLEEAQKQDLMTLMLPAMSEVATNSPDFIAQWMLTNKDAIMDTLTTTPKSRLRGRKLHGATRKKRATVKTTTTDPGKGEP